MGEQGVACFLFQKNPKGYITVNMSQYIRAGGKLNVQALRAIHYSLSTVALTNARVIFSKEKLEMMLKEVCKFSNSVEKFEAHIHLVAAVALENNGTMKRSLVHNEFAFFTAITNVLIAFSKNNKGFETFQAFKAECSVLRFHTTKRTLNPDAAPFLHVKNTYPPKPPHPRSNNTKPRFKPNETTNDSNDESDYSDVAEEEGDEHNFATVDYSKEITPQPYYRWPALIEKGSGVIDDPLTWVKWGDMMVDIDVPPVSPSLISSPSFSLHCDSETSLDASSGIACNGPFSAAFGNC